MPGRFDNFLHSDGQSREGQYIMSQLTGEPRPKISWSYDEKLVLLVIRRFYDTQGKDVPLILIRYFNCSPDRFGSGQCASRFSSLCRDKERSWREVYRENDFHRPGRTVQEILARIEHVARSIRLRLVRKHFETSTVPRPFQRRMQQRHRSCRPTSIMVRRSSVSNRSDFLPNGDAEDHKEVIEISDDEQAEDRKHETLHTQSLPNLSSGSISTPLSAEIIVTPSDSLRNFRAMSQALSEAVPNTPCPPPRQRITEKAIIVNDINNTPIKISSPTLEAPAILFRTYTNASAGINERSNFRAAWFQRNDPIPSPRSMADDIFLQSVGKHLRRDPCQSMFISFSPSLLWVLHKAIHIEESAATEIRVATIDRAQIESDHIWHVEPMLKRIKQMSQDGTAFFPSKHKKYVGSAEWLVFGQVNSIIHTITLATIEKLATDIEPVNAILRLHVMKKHVRMHYLCQAFAQYPVRLSWDNVIGFAMFLPLFGIMPSLPVEVIEAGVSAVVHGWTIVVDVEAQDHLLEQAFKLWVFYSFDMNPDASTFDAAAASAAFAKGIQNMQENVHKQIKRFQTHLNEEKSQNTSAACATKELVTSDQQDHVNNYLSASLREHEDEEEEDGDYDFMADVEQFFRGRQ